MEPNTYYKVLAEDGSACHGGCGKWPLPKGGKPGEWLEVSGSIVPCRNGLHVCEKSDLVHWLGPAIFLCEVSGETVRDEHKSVVAKARLVSRINTWNDRTARLFAADCADKAIRDWQKASGKKCDPRSHAAIRAAREFASGNITAAELSAARSAAESAAWAAERSAAESAAWAAAESAAWAAERSAAWAAERSAAWSWQTKRLFEYLDGKRG